VNQNAKKMILGKPELRFIEVFVSSRKFANSRNCKKQCQDQYWFIVRYDPKIVRDKRFNGELCVPKEWLI